MKKTLALLFALIFLGAVLPLRTRAIPGDEHWDPQFNWPGTTNVILAIASNGGKIYAGGYMVAQFPTNAPLMLWDGAQWSTFASFTYGNNDPTINDIATMNGALYVAGSFTNVNGAAIGGLAKWDGSSWSSVGLSGSVAGLAVNGNNLYAAGAFTNADGSGVIMTNIGYFDGSAWHALGSGVGTPGNGFARAVAVKSGLVYAGGFFTNCGSLAITNIAVWNGTSWSSVGSGIGSLIVYSLAINGSDLYAGGIITSAGSTPVNNIARWDGANWWAVGSGLNSNVTSMAVMGANLYVAGMFTNAGGIAASEIALWNGGYWTNLSSGVIGSGVINSLAAAGGNLYAGGTFTNMGGIAVNRVAKWDGTNWTALGNGVTFPGTPSASVNGLGISGNSLYVSGNFRMAGDKPSFYIARWNGLVNYDTPQLINPGLANGRFHLRLAGISGQTNIILATTNFTSWTPIFTNSAGIYDFTDSNSPAYHSRFYRAVLGP